MMTPENIIVIVSDYFNIPIDRVLSTCRKEEYVKVRHISMYFMKNYIKGIGLKEIGKNFPGKTDYVDHATVLHGIKSVKGYIDVDKYYKRDIDILDTKITELFNIDSVLKHIETESEKFERLWNERERILVCENKHLKEEILNLKSEANKLQGIIYAIKLNKRKRIKKDKGIEKLKSIPIYASSYIKS
jgi:predicted RNase H-like nuclease (RuvC/YqgF family)